MSELDHVRADIEWIDRALIRLIGARMRAARRAAAVKRLAGLPTVDPAQEAVVIGRSATLARDAGLPEEDVRDVFWRLVSLARRAELDP
jgi:chorismate mutase